jgi:hypothetical protein
MEAHTHAAMEAMDATAAPPMHAAAHAHRHEGHGASLTWRPTVDHSDCRFRGLAAHAVLLGVLAMCVVPHAVAARNRKRFLLAAVAMFVLACVSSGLQRTCVAHGGHAALKSGNMHEVLGWMFIIIVLLASALSLRRPAAAPGDDTRRKLAQVARVANAAVLRASSAVLGLPVALQGWALVMACVSGALLLLSGVWATLNCFESPQFTGYEIGKAQHTCL